MAGIPFRLGEKRAGLSGIFSRRSGGTLTGLAIRTRDNKRVVVSCAHTLLGRRDDLTRIGSPTGSERIYQGDLARGRRDRDQVGDTVTEAYKAEEERIEN